MNFVSLVVHGLSAMSVFTDRIVVRLLILLVLLVLCSFLGILSIIFIRLLTELAIPGWATTAVGLLGLLLTQLIILMVVLIFFILNGRDKLTILPKRDFHFFIQGSHTIYEQSHDD